MHFPNFVTHMSIDEKTDKRKNALHKGSSFFSPSCWIVRARIISKMMPTKIWSSCHTLINFTEWTTSNLSAQSVFVTNTEFHDSSSLAKRLGAKIDLLLTFAFDGNAILLLVCDFGTKCYMFDDWAMTLTMETNCLLVVLSNDFSIIFVIVCLFGFVFEDKGKRKTFWDASPKVNLCGCWVWEYVRRKAARELEYVASEYDDV